MAAKFLLGRLFAPWKANDMFPFHTAGLSPRRHRLCSAKANTRDQTAKVRLPCAGYTAISGLIAVSTPPASMCEILFGNSAFPWTCRRRRILRIWLLDQEAWP